jgi:hypothetical protein
MIVRVKSSQQLTLIFIFWVELAEMAIESIIDHTIHGYKKQNSRDGLLVL